jgi:hypothetical protein
MAARGRGAPVSTDKIVATAKTVNRMDEEQLKLFLGYLRPAHLQLIIDNSDESEELARAAKRKAIQEQMAALRAEIEALDLPEPSEPKAKSKAKR